MRNAKTGNPGVYKPKPGNLMAKFLEKKPVLVPPQKQSNSKSESQADSSKKSQSFNDSDILIKHKPGQLKEGDSDEEEIPKPRDQEDITKKPQPGTKKQGSQEEGSKEEPSFEENSDIHVRGNSHRSESNGSSEESDKTPLGPVKKNSSITSPHHNTPIIQGNEQPRLEEQEDLIKSHHSDESVNRNDSIPSIDS